MSTKKTKNKDKPKVKTFIDSETITFKLKKGQYSYDLGKVNTNGIPKVISIIILGPDNSTWITDLTVDCNKYNQSRRSCNNQITKWNHISTNTFGSTNPVLYINNTSGLKDTECKAKITINNQ
tara:strand:+ start:6381 stop:6749 length:369 start_codon:yes stop_codon:yes gene_type:complete